MTLSQLENENISHNMIHAFREFTGEISVIYLTFQYYNVIYITCTSQNYLTEGKNKEHLVNYTIHLYWNINYYLY